MDYLNSMSIYGGAGAGAAATASPGNSVTINASDGSVLPQSFSSLLRATESSELENNPVNSATHPAAGGFLNQLWINQSRNDVTPTGGQKQTSVDFINSIIAPAKLAAEKLGTSTAAVIAVAALETGWGKHVIKNSETSSYNLFGIKAGKAENHSVAVAETFEYIDGVKVKLEQPFRSYGSFNESIADFANFIQSNPRYSSALSNASDPNAFIEEIHRAGYATDPQYAAKVKQVMVQVEGILQNQSESLSKL